VADKRIADWSISLRFLKAALYAKWFAQPIPPEGANLNIPMSPAMKRAFEKPTDSPDA
jgi:glutamate/aspartate transport system substrate-binding protein